MAAIRQANQQRIIQEIQRGGLPKAITVNMTNAVAAALNSLGKDINPFFQQLGAALGSKGIPDAYLKQANMQLALQAQEAVVSGWRSTLPVNAPPYRRGPDPRRDRLAGLLGPTLAEGDMLRGTTSRTISFLNTARLGQEARHWYRVNYGARGPKVSPGEPGSFPVVVGGKTLFMLHDERPPADHSWLPRAFRYEGTQFFQPKVGPADVAGGGSRAALFTDLGFRSIARNFGPVYSEMLQNYARTAAGGARLKAHEIDVAVVLRGFPQVKT